MTTHLAFIFSGEFEIDGEKQTPAATRYAQMPLFFIYPYQDTSILLHFVSLNFGNYCLRGIAFALYLLLLLLLSFPLP